MITKLKQFVKSRLAIKKIISTEIPIYHGELLKGKTALIFGGSGGIGSAIANAFIEQGAYVVLVGTNEKKLVHISEHLGKEKASYIVADIRQIDQVIQVIAKATQTQQKIDIFVHAAGTHCHDKFGNVLPETWENVMDINLKSMYFACQEISNYMIKNNIKGHILNIGSASANKPGWTPYEISKAGVKSLTLGFADKLIQHDIVVNGLAPGPVLTPMLKTDKTGDLSWPGNPTGRMSTPSEIANWAVFMASDMGNMVVGDTFFVSGGSGTICMDK